MTRDSKPGCVMRDPRCGISDTTEKLGSRGSLCLYPVSRNSYLVSRLVELRRATGEPSRVVWLTEGTSQIILGVASLSDRLPTVWQSSISIAPSSMQRVSAPAALNGCVRMASQQCRTPSIAFPSATKTGVSSPEFVMLSLEPRPPYRRRSFLCGVSQPVDLVFRSLKGLSTTVPTVFGFSGSIRTTFGVTNYVPGCFVSR